MARKRRDDQNQRTQLFADIQIITESDQSEPAERCPISDYFRMRDFEYAQPLYDMAFLLEIDAILKAEEIPKYRTFSLWRAGYSLDGYGTTIDRWLDGTQGVSALDHVPSTRIWRYLNKIKATGSIPELTALQGVRLSRCLRLRAVRGLGPVQIARAASPKVSRLKWLSESARILGEDSERLAKL